MNFYYLYIDRKPLLADLWLRVANYENGFNE